MRFLPLPSLPAALALLAGTLVLAGCDSDGGDESDALGTQPLFSFASSGSATVAEDAGDTYEMTVVVRDPGYQELRVDVVFDEESSGVSFDELGGIERTTTLSFPQSTTDSTERVLTFEVLDDDEIGEAAEEVVFTLANPQPGQSSVGAQGTFSLTVEDDDLEAVAIAEARAASLGETVAVTGVVTRAEGSNVRLQDETGGLVVRSDALAGALESGAVSIGDRVRAMGPLGAYNGLLQLGGGDVRYRVVEEDAGLPDAQSVTLADVQPPDGEDYESELVRAEGLEVSSAEAGAAFEAGANYTVGDARGDSLTLRVPTDSDYAGAPIPGGPFTFTGVLGQFSGADDPSVDEGYQLLVTREGDLNATGGDSGNGEAEVLLREDFSDGLGAFTAYSVASDQDWGTDSNESVPGSPYAVISGYNNDGEGEASNDWLISPTLNFDDAERETLTFLNEKGFSDTELPDGERGLQVLVSTTYDGESNPEDFEWTDLSARAAFDASDGSTSDGPGFDAFDASGTIDLSDAAFQSDAVYVAFKYTSSGTASGAALTWEVDDVLIREEGAGGSDRFPEPPGRP